MKLINILLCLCILCFQCEKREFSKKDLSENRKLLTLVENENLVDTLKSSTCISHNTKNEFPFTSTELYKYEPFFEKSNCIQGDVDEFLCGETHLRYIPLIKRDSLDIILVPLDCGDFNLHQLLVLKNNLLISNIQVDGKWYEVDNPDDYKLTQFTLDKDFRLKVTIDEYQNNTLSESNKHNYLIDKNGFIVEE